MLEQNIDVKKGMSGGEMFSYQTAKVIGDFPLSELLHF